MRFLKKSLSILFITSLLPLAVFAQILQGTGRYCGTASRCDNPMVMNGLVTTPHYLATQAGVDVLRRGGNAVDAAIAASAVLTVVYPHMTTLGGDNTWLIYNNKTNELKALNASGQLGEKISMGFYREKGLKQIPARGYLAINSVPGAVAGWQEAWDYASQSMGTNLNWKQLFDNAINYAEHGFPVNHSFAQWSKINVDSTDKILHNLQRFSAFEKIYLKTSGTHYNTGDLLKQPELAYSLSLIASQGAEVFYKGSIAERITQELSKHDALLTKQDFANYAPHWEEPLSVDYRDYKAYTLPSSVTGISALAMLNIASNFNIKSLKDGSADYFHSLTEVSKYAFAERDALLFDPDFSADSLKILLSKDRGQVNAKKIETEQAAILEQTFTINDSAVWVGIVDAQGNAVSLIQGIYRDFGSGIVAGGTGILLQGYGDNFPLEERYAHLLNSGKSIINTLAPAMLFKNNKPYLIYGAAGGGYSPQTLTSMVTRIVDFNLSPQDTLNATRWLYNGTNEQPTHLSIEGRLPKTVIAELENRGHSVTVMDNYSDLTGHAGAILIYPESEVRLGATDPRSDGSTAGY